MTAAVEMGAVARVGVRGAAETAAEMEPEALARHCKVQSEFALDCDQMMWFIDLITRTYES